jgi:hypothetical protein
MQGGQPVVKVRWAGCCRPLTLLCHVIRNQCAAWLALNQGGINATSVPATNNCWSGPNQRFGPNLAFWPHCALQGSIVQLEPMRTIMRSEDGGLGKGRCCYCCRLQLCLDMTPGT